jgi:hypothetical protein
MNKTKPNHEVTILHNAGFFSCCSVRLHMIIQYFNSYKKLPQIVNSSNSNVVRRHQKHGSSQHQET